jgi:hypothetical protein
MRNARSRPQREFQTRLQVKESNCPMLEFCANNAFGLQAKTIAVELNCPLQIINAKGDKSYPRLHTQTLP